MIKPIRIGRDANFDVLYGPILEIAAGFRRHGFPQRLDFNPVNKELSIEAGPSSVAHILALGVQKTAKALMESFEKQIGCYGILL